MDVNPDFLAPCGLYCGVCGVYYATRDNNETFMEKLLGVYQRALPDGGNLTAEQLHCKGCLSEQRSIFCAACAIRDCTAKKGYEGCYQCGEFPCDHIERFPVPVGKRVMMRAVPHWREVGTEKYVADEEARYKCPQCGHMLFRGAKRCNQCKLEVDLD